jgi:hypothetical protein
MTIDADAVVAFLHHFEQLAMAEDFDLIGELIDERAFFRFNDGDFVGRAAVRAAFEKTGRGDPTIRRPRFYLTDIVVLTVDEKSATAAGLRPGAAGKGRRGDLPTPRGCSRC